MPDLENLVTHLIEHGVDFAVVGGFAAVAHGAPLVTQDLDVCCEFSVDNLMRLQAALSDLHPAHRMSPARPPLELTPENCPTFRNLYLDTDHGQLGCLSGIAGVGAFAEVKRNSVPVRLPAGRCRILSLDALIRAREALGRPRDRQALLHLKAIRERLDQQRPIAAKDQRHGREGS